MRLYRSGDEDRSALIGSTVCVVGYGNLGAAVALNLRDAGTDVVVANREDDYATAARAEGFTVQGIAGGVASADIVMVLLPDEVMPSVFAGEVEPSLRPGSAVCFASGYCLAFGLVRPPPSVDVLLLAPRMLGQGVRRAAVDGSGFVAFVSVEHDATGEAERRLLALAGAAGALTGGAFVLPARDEALLDLLIEQTVGPYIGLTLQIAFDVAVEAGLPPEAVVLELYQSGEMAATFRAFTEAGFYRSVRGHGLTAQFGGLQRTLGIDAEAIRRQFEATLADIRSGGFARSFQAEREAGYPSLGLIEGITSGNDPMTQAEQRVRAALRGR